MLQVLTSDSSRKILSRSVCFLLILCILILGTICFVDALQWINKSFPGFLVAPRMVAAGGGQYHWTGTEAGLKYPDKLLTADDRQIRTPRELYQLAERAPIGTLIHYTFERNGQVLSFTIPTMKFSVSDFVIIVGGFFLVAAIYLILGVIVFVLKPDTPTSWSFLLLCSFLSAVYLTSFDVGTNDRGYLRWYMFFITFIPAAVIHLSLLFPNPSRFVRRYPALQLVPYIISAAIVIPLEVFYPGPIFLVAQKFVYLYLLVGALALVSSSLISYLWQTSVIGRQRAIVVLFGAALAFPLPALGELAMFLGSTFRGIQVQANYLAFPLTLFPAAIAYAIAKHNLFDVDVYIKRTVGYVIMTVLVGMGYFSMESLTATVILRPILGESAQKASPILFALLVVLCFNPVHKRVQALVDKAFFRKPFDYKQVINSVGNALTSVVALGEIITRIISIIRKEMFLDIAGVIVLDQEKQACQTFMIGDGASSVRDSTKDVCITPDDPLLLLLSQEKKLITKYDIAEDPRYVSVREPCGRRFAELGASLALPLIYQDRLTGVLALGYKKSGHFYTREDVDALKTIADQGAVAIEQARLFEEAKKAEVVTLLGDIGHDLKNLLQPVVSGAWLLKGELDEVFAGLPTLDPGKARASQELCDEALGMIRRTSERIHDRVKEIADCVKGLSAPPQFKPCKVAGVAEDVLQTLRVLAAEKDVSLHCKDLDALPTILADERRLYNAFYNLVNNAIPEVPKGGSITVCGRADPTAGVIHVSVADTGRGMPPEVRDRLFTARAVSTKATGTGLGTKIVKDVVDAHRGQITVDSEVGVGTTFHIRLPLDPTRLEAVKS